MDTNHSENFSFNTTQTLSFGKVIEINKSTIIPSSSANVTAMDFLEYRWSLKVQAIFGVFIVAVGILGVWVNLAFPITNALSLSVSIL